MSTAVIIPAYNEEESIGHVLDAIPENFKSRVIVANNNSTDTTVEVAKKHGAIIVNQTIQGYGAACLKGLEELKEDPPEVVLFIDGDFSDNPADLGKIHDYLKENDLDLVIGSRVSLAEKGALLPQARFGNWLATTLLALRYKYKFSDLGPQRAITWKALERMQMEDMNFGWTMEMQIKALKYGLKVGEIPVDYKKRIGESKITGTLKGTVMAGYKILWTLFRYSF